MDSVFDDQASGNSDAGPPFGENLMAAAVNGDQSHRVARAGCSVVDEAHHDMGLTVKGEWRAEKKRQWRAAGGELTRSRCGADGFPWSGRHICPQDGACGDA